MIGERVKGLPEYSKAEVGTRDDPSKSVWVTYGNGVYDITSFIDHHPGAKNILMAAGGSIEPFWDIYAVHKGNAEVNKHFIVLFRVCSKKVQKQTSNCWF